MQLGTASKPHSGGPALNRKLLRRPDQFLAFLQSFFGKLAGHSKAVVLVIGTAVTLSAVLAFFLYWRTEQVAKAADALYLAEKSLKSTIDTAKIKPTQPLDPKAELAEPVGKLEKITQDYAKDFAGFRAALILGNLNFDHGKVEESLAWYQKAREWAPSPLEEVHVLNLVGTAFEVQKKYTEALTTYDQALRLRDVGIKSDLLIAQARSHRELGQKDKAQLIYDQILSEFPGTPAAKSAEELKAEL